MTGNLGEGVVRHGQPDPDVPGECSDARDVLDAIDKDTDRREDG